MLDGDMYTAERMMHMRVGEELHQAQARRLLRHALAGREKYTRVYSGALAWLGHRLVGWGQRLQERHSAASTPLPQSANRLVS